MNIAINNFHFKAHRQETGDWRTFIIQQHKTDEKQKSL